VSHVFGLSLCDSPLHYSLARVFPSDICKCFSSRGSLALALALALATSLTFSLSPSSLSYSRSLSLSLPLSPSLSLSLPLSLSLSCLLARLLTCSLTCSLSPFLPPTTLPLFGSLSPFLPLPLFSCLSLPLSPFPSFLLSCSLALARSLAYARARALASFLPYLLFYSHLTGFLQNQGNAFEWLESSLLQVNNPVNNSI